MVAMLFHKADPRPVAELMCQSFLRHARAPGTRRAAVVDMLYVHRPGLGVRRKKDEGGGLCVYWEKRGGVGGGCQMYG
jgi:hypothetical protein